MLQANTLLRESGDSSSAFEDYSLFLYRQEAPEFGDRVKEMELKLRYPVRNGDQFLLPLCHRPTPDFFLWVQRGVRGRMWLCDFR